MSDLAFCMEQGDLFVISAPSGTGKTTICRRILQEVPGVEFSVSYTTRPPRRGEVDGRDYHFVDTDIFQSMVEYGEFLEWARVHGNLYGTGRKDVLSRLEAGRDVLLDIDVQGARQVKAKYPRAVMVFILPPSLRELEDRLAGRGTEDRHGLEVRLENAAREMEAAREYDYAVVNDELARAVQDVEAIIRAARLRTERALSRWKI